MEQKKKKTWASELAMLILLVWLVITVYIFGFMDPDAVSNYEAIYNTLTLGVFGSVFTTLGFKRHVESRDNVPVHPDGY